MKTKKIISIKMSKKIKILALAYLSLLISLDLVFSSINNEIVEIAKVKYDNQKKELIVLSQPIMGLWNPEKDVVLPYYEIILNDKIKFKTDKLEFFVPIINQNMNIKIVYLPTHAVIYDGVISFCNYDGICQTTESEACDDCQRKFDILELNKTVALSLSNIEKTVEENIHNGEKSFYLSVGLSFVILIGFLTLLYSFLYFTKKKRKIFGKRGNVGLMMLIIVAISLVFLFIDSITVANITGVLSKRAEDVFDDAELLRMCKNIYNKYNHLESVKNAVFFGTIKCRCLENNYDCTGMCNKFVSFFDVQQKNIISFGVIRIKCLS